MAEAMHIALLTHSVNPRGGVVHTLELARALHQLGHRVRVMAPAEPGQRLFRSVSFEVDLIPVPAVAASVREMVARRIDAFVHHLEQVLASERFDVLHAQDGTNGNALADLRQRGCIPGFLRTIHHLDQFADPQVTAWQHRAWAAATQCLCVSDTWIEHMRREHGVVAERVSNGVDMQRFSPLPDAHDEKLARRLGVWQEPGPIYLTVGGVEARKNTLRSLQAFIQVHAHQPDARLIVAGGASLLDHSAYAREFQSLLQASGLAVGSGCPVQIAGAIPDDEMPALFRLADVLLMPSLREGFGLVVLEALACGTPVVASRIAPFTEYLGDALCHWCDPQDAGSIALAMEAASTARRGEPLRGDARALLERFSWRASAQRHLQIYARHVECLRTAGAGRPEHACTHA